MHHAVQIAQGDLEEIHPTTLGTAGDAIKKSHVPDAVYTFPFPASNRLSTMRRTLLLSILLVLSTVRSASASAGDLQASLEGRSPSFSLGAFAGGHFFAEGTNLGVASGAQASRGARSGAAAGLRASLGLGRWFGAEAEVLGLATEDRTYQRKARVLGYRINAMANLMSGDFRPFVLVGAGAIQVASTDAEGNAGLVRDTDGEVHVGVGFDYRLVDLLSVRGDARVVQMPSKQSWGLTSDVEATLGALVTFGGGTGKSAHDSPPGMAPRTTTASLDDSAPAPVEAAPATLPPPAPLPPVAGTTLRVESTPIEAEEPENQEDQPVTLVAPTPSVTDLLARGKEIKFEGATSKIAEASIPFLDELAAALMKEPGVRLEIVCHTSDSGDAKKDMVLTRRRAEAVKYLLVGKGVSTDQLVAIGRGSEDPLAPNITRSGRMRNERVELHRAGSR
jgi:outer membrane protein OmpA-like peptidoglycan-associated protein